MRRELPEQLLHDLNAALTIMSARSPEHAHEVERMRQAIQKGSPVLYRRFHVLADNVLNSPARDEMTREEKHEIGQCLSALSEMAALGKPGPKARGYEYRLMIYLDDEDHTALTDYCEREKISRAEAVRRGVRALT